MLGPITETVAVFKALFWVLFIYALARKAIESSSEARRRGELL